MDKLEIINSLVRLSAIAEELEEKSPQAAEQIDSFVDDAASQIGEEVDEPSQMDKNLFPPVNTPVLQPGGNTNLNQQERGEVKEIHEDQSREHEDAKDLAQLITQEIESSEEFKKLLPHLGSEDGENALNALIEKQINQVLPNAD